MANLFKNPWGKGGELSPEWHKKIIEPTLDYKVSGIILFNDSPKPIYYKPEDGCTPQIIPAGKRNLYIKADGVATMFSKTQVFKIPDFAQVFITESGEIQYTAQTFALAIVLGGWKDYAWLSSRVGDDKKCWGQLFDAAKNQE